MKNLRSNLFMSLGLVAGGGSLASANSFNVNEHDARVTGRGGAMAASDDDASSIVFNPAGLARIDGTNISIGGTLYVAKGSYENDSTSTVETDSPPTPVPNVYFGTRLNDMRALLIPLVLLVFAFLWQIRAMCSDCGCGLRQRLSSC